MYTRIYKEGLVLRLVLILSLVGFGLSGYLTYLHYNMPESCPIGGECDKVLTSPYSVVFGIPVALMALIGFLMIFFLSFLRLYYPDLDFVESFPTYILIFAVIGAAFSIYLTVIEIFVIQAICGFCFSAFLTIVAILGLITYGVLKGEGGELATERQVD